MRWPEADRIFHADPRWLGGDDAHSVDLGNGRTLWLFGDSFIATPGSRSRERSTMVHSSVALQDGLDPTTARMTYHWGVGRDGQPRSLLPDGPRADEWVWPAHGVVLNGVLLLFAMRVRTTATGLPFLDAWRERGSLGFFETVGWTAYRIANWTDEPGRWNFAEVDAPAAGGLLAGAGGVLVDGERLVAMAPAPGGHVVLLSWDAGRAAGGDLRSPRRSEVMEGMPSEFSVLASGGRYLAIHMSMPLGGTVCSRSAATLEGPWSETRPLWRAPEADRPGVMAYAAKAHPHLAGPGMPVTYNTINMDADLTLGDASIYHPRFMLLPRPQA